MAAPRDITVEELPAEALRRLVGELLGEVARLRQEIACLKGLSGRPKIRPSGMERATAQRREAARQDQGRRQGHRVVVHEEHVLAFARHPRITSSWRS